MHSWRDDPIPALLPAAFSCDQETRSLCEQLSVSNQRRIRRAREARKTAQGLHSCQRSLSHGRVTPHWRSAPHKRTKRKFCACFVQVFCITFSYLAVN